MTPLWLLRVEQELGFVNNRLKESSWLSHLLYRICACTRRCTRHTCRQELQTEYGAFVSKPCSAVWTMFCNGSQRHSAISAEERVRVACIDHIATWQRHACRILAPQVRMLWTCVSSRNWQNIEGYVPKEDVDWRFFGFLLPEVCCIWEGCPTVLRLTWTSKHL